MLTHVHKGETLSVEQGGSKGVEKRSHCAAVRASDAASDALPGASDALWPGGRRRRHSPNALGLSVDVIESVRCDFKNHA